ncbi:VCBS repeat-containing protein, partial [Patescibacteria group bacterium]|nr:VCBS repeat-containing protein [Patescibacteria group bacterium]
IASLDNQAKQKLLVDGQVKVAYASEANLDEAAKFGAKAKEAAVAWNKNLVTKAKQTPEGTRFEDSRAPELDLKKIIEESKKTVGGTYGVGYYDTSEYMLGNISIAVVLPESNGSIDPSTENWDSAREQLVQSEVLNALDWWVARSQEHTNQNISFTTHFYNGRTDARAQTGYEPISNPGLSAYNTWIPEIMANFGHTSETGDVYKGFFRNYDFVNEMRNNDGTDWGVVMYIADSNNDADGRYSDGRVAFSYIGGPFLQMTYDNYGYGIGMMDTVAAHELGHSFYAMDQYYSAGTDCRVKSGYSFVENQNSEYKIGGGNCATDEVSLMRSEATTNLDPSARGQIGWLDSNTNTIPDILENNPTVALDASESILETTSPSFTGSATVGIENNLNLYEHSYESSGYSTLHKLFGFDINNSSTDQIESIQVRVDGGVWSMSSDFTTDYVSGSSTFVANTSGLSVGEHTVEVRAVSKQGDTVGVGSRTFTVGHAPEAVSSLSATRVSEGAEVSWSNPEQYFSHVRVLRKTDGAPSHMSDGEVVYEGSATSFIDTSVENKQKYYYTVFPVSGLGVVGTGNVVEIMPVYNYIVTGSGKDRSPYVRLFDYHGQQKGSFLAYADSMKHGLEVATGDLDGDGIDEIITGAGEGAGPQVRVFDSAGKVKMTNGFFAFNDKFRGGIHVASGDLDGDGKEEIIVGAGPGGGPHVRIFDGEGNEKFTRKFFPYTKNFRGGVHVASGDLDGDGMAEVITSPGEGGGPHVRIFDRNAKAKHSPNGFFAYAPAFRGGVTVASADLNADGKAEIITGTTDSGGSHVRTFRRDGKATFTPGFFAYGSKVRNGVNVAAHDLNNDNKAEIITGAGSGGGPQVRMFTRYGKETLNPGFFSENVDSRSGVKVAAGSF